MKILIVDIETTDFLNKGGKILEIGATEVDLRNKEFNIVFDRSLNHESLTIDELQESWIAKNSNIISTYWDRKEDSGKVIKDFQILVNKYEHGVTAYNNKFDFTFLESYGIVFPVKLSCLMMLSTYQCRIPRKGYGNHFKWPKVQEAFDHFFPKNDYIEKHRGADDSYHEAKIALKLYDLGVLKVSI